MSAIIARKFQLSADACSDHARLAQPRHSFPACSNMGSPALLIAIPVAAGLQRRDPTAFPRSRQAFPSCRRLQRLVEIGEDVVDMLDADRQADIVVRHPGRELFFGRKL